MGPVYIAENIIACLAPLCDFQRKKSHEWKVLFHIVNAQI
jgi:hypothetical protein